MTTTADKEEKENGNRLPKAQEPERLPIQSYDNHDPVALIEQYSDITGRVALSIFLLNHFAREKDSQLFKEVQSMSTEYRHALRGHANALLQMYVRDCTRETIEIKETDLWQRAVTGKLGSILSSYEQIQRSEFEDFKAELRRITSPWMQLLIGVLSGIVFGILVYQLQQLPSPFGGETVEPMSTNGRE